MRWSRATALLYYPGEDKRRKFICMAKKNQPRRSGWAYTKWYPHKNHPAFWRKKGRAKDDIEYLTITHSSKITFDDGVSVEGLPLSDSISPKEREENKGLPKGQKRNSYVVPYVYEGKRSSLGTKTNEFSFLPEDYQTIQRRFSELPRKKVPQTGGQRKGKQKKKPPK